MATKTETFVDTLKINKLTKKLYDEAKKAGQIKETELYVLGEVIGDMDKSTYDTDNDGVLNYNSLPNLTIPIFVGKGKEIIVTSAANRIENVTSHGFTEQAGSGDPSPTNVRPITVGGRKLVKKVLTGEENWRMWWSTPGFYYIQLEINAINAESQVNVYGEIYKGQTRSKLRELSPIYDKQCAASAGELVICDMSCSTVDDFKNKIKTKNLSVWYTPADESDATGIYTPQISDGESYHCECIELQQHLCEGDTVDSNVPSGCDKSAVFDGSPDEAWGMQASGANTLFYLQGVLIGNSKTASDALSNLYPNTGVWGGNTIEGFSGYDESLYVRDFRYSTVEDFKAALAANPLIVYYRSVEYTTENNEKACIERHVRRYMVVDGATVMFEQGTEGYKVTLKNAQSGAVKCNRFKSLTVASGAVTIPASQFPAEVTNSQQANEWAKTNNVQLEYELASPAIYAQPAVDLPADPITTAAQAILPEFPTPDTPMLLAQQGEVGTYTVSGEKTVSVYLKPIQDGGDAKTLEGYSSSDFALNYHTHDYLPLAGGTLTGFLTLNANPTANLHAATKQYVDGKILAAGGGDMLKSVYDTDADGVVDKAVLATTATNATTASKVANSLIVKMNSGAVEGTSQFTFNGSAAKTINITPMSIGAAAASHTHDHAQVVGMTAGRAIVSDSSGKLTESAVTSTELGYLDGVTKNIQSQLNEKATSEHTHGLGHPLRNNIIPKRATDEGWSDFGVVEDGFLLQSGTTNTLDAPPWTMTDSAVIAFGGPSNDNNNKAAITVGGEGFPEVKFAGGNGTGPTWNFQINGTSGKIYDLSYLNNVKSDIQTQLNAKASSSHTHTKSQITDFPTSIKNPAALTLQFNGSTNQTYDGSVAKTFNVTPTAIGALPADQPAVGAAKSSKPTFAVNYGRIVSLDNSGLYLRNADNEGAGVFVGVREDFQSLTPDHSTSGGSSNLGAPSYRWRIGYFVNQPNISSDQNKKEQIEPLSEKQMLFFDSLNPVQYKLKGDSHDRLHYGFIAQEVEQAMAAVGISDMEFGGFCKDRKIQVVRQYSEEGELIGEEEKKLEEYEYSLRYGEFIALNTAAIQALKKEVQKLKEEIKQLKGE